jgi:hypothetical protein
VNHTHARLRLGPMASLKCKFLSEKKPSTLPPTPDNPEPPCDPKAPSPKMDVTFGNCCGQPSADPFPNRANNGSVAPVLHLYAGCICTIVWLSGRRTPIALLFAWLAADLHVLADNLPAGTIEQSKSGPLRKAATASGETVFTDSHGDRPPHMAHEPT